MKFQKKYEELKDSYKKLKEKHIKEYDADDDFSMGFSGNSPRIIHPLSSIE